MASNLLLIVLLVLVSLSLSTRDAVSKRQDDESYVLATRDQESSMVVVEDLVKGRLLARVGRSEVFVNKAVSKRSTSSKSSKGSKKKHKSKKVGSLEVAAFVGIIIAVIVIICVIYFIYLRHKTKKAQSSGQGTATEKFKESSETHTSKTEERV